MITVSISRILLIMSLSSHTDSRSRAIKFNDFRPLISQMELIKVASNSLVSIVFLIAYEDIKEPSVCEAGDDFYAIT